MMLDMLDRDGANAAWAAAQMTLAGFPATKNSILGRYYRLRKAGASLPLRREQLPAKPKPPLPDLGRDRGGCRRPQEQEGSVRMAGPTFEKQVCELRRCGLNDREIAKKLGAHFGRVARVQEIDGKRNSSVPFGDEMWKLDSARSPERT